MCTFFFYETIYNNKQINKSNIPLTSFIVILARFCKHIHQTWKLFLYENQRDNEDLHDDENLLADEKLLDDDDLLDNDDSLS